MSKKPEFSSLLNEYVEPNINLVAEAIARNYGWTIAPSGETSLNLLGISTQVTSHYEFISSGPYRKYCINGITISFSHRVDKDFTGMSYKTKLLTQAIKPEKLNDLINEESELLFVSLHTKTPEWIGEQEWRFNIPLENGKSNLIDFDFATSIYLGENITDYWKNQLIDIAREQNLKVYQRKLNKTKSNWIYEKIVF